ncbi:MAG: glycosyl hydrolase, partial [Planctomycetota bacterium]
MKRLAYVVVFGLLLMLPTIAQEGVEPGKGMEPEPAIQEKEKSLLEAGTFSGLALRGIGPALMSGRIIDIAKDPGKKSLWYVAVASGGVWKTENTGTTWSPIFDSQGSYSIGCVTIDPLNPLCVWVGTGENNSQRSVGFGDGLYRSLDGGKTWEKKGLEASEHIGKILIDPRDSKVLYVAAQGPLWAPGGDRGLYKSTDRGDTWSLVLKISENTGVSDIAFDPRDPDILYASSYQRRRHVWTLIDGGPESAIYKSYDRGTTWQKLEQGLPKKDVGRIALAVSPIRPDVVYALIEAEDDTGGFFRSIDAGGSWEKRSGYGSVSPQYYQELFPDPHVFDRVYSMDTLFMVTDDGGKTFYAMEEKFKHVDNHALVFDPDDPDYLLVGCDGGLYESFDRSANWDFKANLPVTQFYKLCVDNDLPFYNVYGGTQDNNTQGGPSRTLSKHGITNQDWIITKGGDGFKPQVDPTDPNIIYCQSQHGELQRFDKQSGERIDIQPQPEPGEEALRWNWDSPLMISPHSHMRLYFAANRIFRSQDRGDSWQPISPDLTRCIDRETLKVMGKIWSVDAVSKHNSTSFYGNIVALAESPLKEGLLYAGTDDGLVQVSADGGTLWQKIDSFPGIPELAYVADIEASIHDEDTVFVVFNAHKSGDFKPYILMSTDRGKSWTSLSGDLPERGPVWAIAQDHIANDLFFAGTEFGLFFTPDRGGHWIQLKGGLPTIAMRDIEIQRRESDLACASFGRGFFIFDDYSPLRGISESMLEEEAHLFPVKEALQYIPTQLLGGREKASQGDAFYTAPNPPYGAVFTYYLKEGLKTLKEKRKESEKEIDKEGGVIPWPGWDRLRAEDEEEQPEILLFIRDEAGEPVRILSGPVEKGFHRAAWDLRYPAFAPFNEKYKDSG